MENLQTIYPGINEAEFGLRPALYPRAALRLASLLAQTGRKADSERVLGELAEQLRAGDAGSELIKALEAQRRGK